jgi:intracellular septation protein
MDKRLVLELAPGPVFLIGNALGGILLGAVVAACATGLAILLRWRWDRSLPWLAISIFVLTLSLVVAGLVLNDTTYIKISSTIGSLAFAAIVALGRIARPSLLERSLGHSIRMTEQGWHRLHDAWIAVSLVRAAANELVWRSTSDQRWAIYNGISDIAWIGVFILVTYLMAPRYSEQRE